MKPLVAAPRIWVAQLLISTRTARKITERHQITPQEVQDSVVCVPGLKFSLHVDDERGERAILRVSIRGRPALVVLYDAGHPFGDVWHLGSTYFIDN